MSGSKARIEAFFLSTPKGRRFGLARWPHAAPVGGLCFVPPFAEELNRSRRMCAIAADAFAASGWLVLQLDLFGSGDSDGDFGEATWHDWVDDITLGHEWLLSQGVPRVALWTLRSGSLLASSWLLRTNAETPLLLWQPSVSGAQSLTQFLRLGVSRDEAERDGQSPIGLLRAELDAGRSVEIGGYTLSAALAAGLGAAEVELPPTFKAPVALFEVVGTERNTPSPALSALQDRWRSAGIPTTLDIVNGPAFWMTQEVETAPALVQASNQALERLSKALMWMTGLRWPGEGFTSFLLNTVPFLA